MKTIFCFSFYVMIVLLLEYHHTTIFTSCSALNITTDQSALLTFKSHIISDPNRILTTNWSITTQASCCSWVGVTCSTRRGRVMALNLSNMGLIGTIPPQIGNLSSWLSKLSNLKYLSLSVNSFTGTIPPSLSNFSKLERLSLGDNPLQGNIPGDFGSFKNLRVLELQNNQLSGSIPLTIFNISTLHNLGLTNNSLSGNLPRDICHGIPKIQGLYLSKNQLSGPIPTGLLECSELQLMSLSFNKFDGIIPREIGNLTLLQKLYLGHNHLKGTIPQEIGSLWNLKILSLSFLNLHGTIPESIFNISRLELIAIVSSNVSGIIPSLNVSAGLLGFFFVKTWTKLLENSGMLNQPFTRQENTVIQTCVVASSGIAFSGGFGSYLYGMSEDIAKQSGEAEDSLDYKNPKLSWMIGFLFVVSFLGLFSVVPLRKVFIAIAMILGDGLYIFVKVLSRTVAGLVYILRKRNDSTDLPVADHPSLVNPPLSYDDQRRMQLFLKEQIPTWFAIGGYITIAAISTATLPHIFHQLKWYYIILIYIFAPTLAFCNAFGCGLTDWSLASTYVKLAIFTIGAWAGSSHGWVMMNIVSTASDLMQDFKTGYLTLASPRSMFVSQAIGTTMGCVISPCVFWVFYKAFPDLGLIGSEYPAPFALVYRNMAKLGVDGFSSLPKNCVFLCYVFFGSAILINLVRDGLGNKRAWFIPLPMAMAIPFYLGSYFAIDMCLGSLILFVWEKINKAKADAFGPAVASGLICGDGIWTLPSSILALAGVKPPICMNFLSRRTNSKVDKFLKPLS